MLERMQNKGNTPPLLVGMQIVEALWKSAWWFLRKLRMNLLQDPAIPLLKIYPKDAQSYYKDICSTMFIAAVFLIVRTWKQPRFPSTKE